MFAMIGAVMFAVGWFCACLWIGKQWNESRAYLIAQHNDEMKRLCGRTYGSNYLDTPGIDPDADKRLKEFDWAQCSGSITLSYYNGLANFERHMRVEANGMVSVIRNGELIQTASIEATRCAAFFRKTLASGILNYSEEVVKLKEDLLKPDSITSVCDASTVALEIVIPGLDVSKSISVYAPDVESKNYPDIIELRLLTEIESEMRTLVPMNE